MVEHIQQSTEQKGFWQPKFKGSLLLPCVFYFGGLEIEIPQTDLSLLQEGDRVFVEADPDPLHLIREGSDTDYAPLSGDPTTSPGPVIWREGGEIHYVRHTEG